MAGAENPGPLQADLDAWRAVLENYLQRVGSRRLHGDDDEEAETEDRCGAEGQNTRWMRCC